MLLSTRRAPNVSLCPAVSTTPLAFKFSLALRRSSTSISASLVNESSEDGPRYCRSPSISATSCDFADVVYSGGPFVARLAMHAVSEPAGCDRTTVGVAGATWGGGERGSCAVSRAFRTRDIIVSMRSRRSLTSSKRCAVRVASLSRFWRSLYVQPVDHTMQFWQRGFSRPQRTCRARLATAGWLWRARVPFSRDTYRRRGCGRCAFRSTCRRESHRQTCSDTARRIAHP